MMGGIDSRSKLKESNNIVNHDYWPRINPIKLLNAFFLFFCYLILLTTDLSSHLMKRFSGPAAISPPPPPPPPLHLPPATSYKITDGSKRWTLQMILDLTVQFSNDSKISGEDLLFNHDQNLTRYQKKSLKFCMVKMEDAMDHLVSATLELQNVIHHRAANSEQVKFVCRGFKQVDYLVALAVADQIFCLERFDHLIDEIDILHSSDDDIYVDDDERQNKLLKSFLSYLNEYPITFGRICHTLAKALLGSCFDLGVMF